MLNFYCSSDQFKFISCLQILADWNRLCSKIDFSFNLRKKVQQQDKIIKNFATNFKWHFNQIERVKQTQ